MTLRYGPLRVLTEWQPLSVHEWRRRLLVDERRAPRYVPAAIVGSRETIITTFLRPFDYVLAPLGASR